MILGHLGGSWVIFHDLAPSWGRFEAIFGDLGPILGQPRRLWADLWRLLAILGRSWAYLRRSLGRFGAHLRRSWPTTTPTTMRHHHHHHPRARATAPSSDGRSCHADSYCLACSSSISMQNLAFWLDFWSKTDVLVGVRVQKWCSSLISGAKFAFWLDLWS